MRVIWTFWAHVWRLCSLFLETGYDTRHEGYWVVPIRGLLRTMSGLPLNPPIPNPNPQPLSLITSPTSPRTMPLPPRTLLCHASTAQHGSPLLHHTAPGSPLCCVAPKSPLLNTAIGSPFLHRATPGSLLQHDAPGCSLLLLFPLTLLPLADSWWSRFELSSCFFFTTSSLASTQMVDANTNQQWPCHRWWCSWRSRRGFNFFPGWYRRESSDKHHQDWNEEQG
jgi:hypothetical protein